MGLILLINLVWERTPIIYRLPLCYYEYFSNQLRLIKPTLGLRDGDLTQRELEVEDKLKSWMNNTPVYLQLQWFDTVEEVKISSELRSKRWNTEVTERDRLYLSKLGMNPK